jgi:ribonuclease BN (tRNA processing enzyme)
MVPLVRSVVLLLVVAVRAEAQSSPPLEVVVLGSGGPRPSARASAGNLVLVDGKPRLLVDAGPGTFLRAGEQNLDLSSLDSILLTHLHIDHSAEVPAFVKARALGEQGSVKLQLFGPMGNTLFPSTRQWSEGLFGAAGLDRYVRNFGAETRVLAQNVPSTRGAIVQKRELEPGLSLLTLGLHHGDAPAVGYRIESEGRSVVFAGDIDPTGLPALERLARGADLLVVSCAVLDPPGSPEALYERHSPPRLLGETAARASVGALLLSHLPPAVFTKLADVEASVRKGFSGPVTFATDGLRVEVTRLSLPASTPKTPP